ncbi:MAG: M56 family metallopeptidase, partial [Chitinophagales bacterium]
MHFITQSIWLKALGWSLLNSFWQMALLWLLYQLITGMGKRFSAGTRHGLALSLSLAGSVGFLLTFLASLSGLGPTNSGLINWRVSGPFLGIAYWTRDLFNVLVPYLAILYLGNLCFLFFPYIQNYRRLRELRYEGLEKMPVQLRIFAQSLSSQMGIRRRVNLWLSSLVDSPLTVGFFKPIILIPMATVNQLSLEQVETILLHELAHIRRNDYVINLLITWMGTLFFFNPFCRLLIQTVGKEREHCCDDLVIQFKYNPHVYASALLSLEKSRDHHAALALAAIGRSRQLLLDRIRRLTGQPGKRSGFNPRITAFF